MANFGGFEMETPQEASARLAQQRQQVMTQGNVFQQRSQNLESALDVLFGNPQVREAKRRMDTIQRAQNSAGPKQANEDDITYEMRRLSGIRDAVSDVDPSIAMQINDRLLQLADMKFQRARLQASDQRQMEAHKVSMDAAADEANARSAYGMNYYVFDKTTEEAQSFNLRDPSSKNAFLEAAKKPNTIVITPQMAATMYMNQQGLENALARAMAKADNAGAGGSKVEQQRLESASAGLLDVYAVADRIFQVLDENPDAITGSAKGGAALDRLATELGAAGRLATGQKLRGSDLSIDDWFKANSITSTRMQGLIVGVAYALAKSDNEGRISDKDLAAAMEMVGANNPNPLAIIANLNDRLTANGQAVRTRIETATPASREALKARLDKLNELDASFKKKMSKYTQGSHGAGASGIGSTNVPDFDSMTAEQLEQWAQQQ